MGTEASQTEQATNGQEAQVIVENEPSGIGEAIAMFRKEQANKPSEGNEESQQSQNNEGESRNEAQGKENEASKSEAQEGEKEGESQEVPFRFVDAEGKAVPFSFKADGEEVVLDLSKPEDFNKLKTWVSLGKYGTKRNEELNKREQALQEAEEMLKDIKGAIRDGRLNVSPSSSSDSKKEPSEEEKAYQEELKALEEIDDPELRKEREERLKLQQELQKQKGEFSALKELVTGKFVEEMYTKMESEIKSLTAEKYPYAKEKDVWDLLAEKEGNTPKYKTIEEAVKISHEAEKSRVSELINKDPELKQRTEEERQAIIADYLKEKAKKEEANAHISSPSDTTADTKTGEQKQEEITGIESAMAQFRKWHKGRKEAGANI